MSTLWLIVVMAAGVYLLRIAGLVLPDVEIPAFWQQALDFVPVALLTALVVSSLMGGSDVEPARFAAVGVGGLVAYRSRKMWACIASGMAAFWLLRMI